MGDEPREVEEVVGQPGNVEEGLFTPDGQTAGDLGTFSPTSLDAEEETPGTPAGE